MAVLFGPPGVGKGTQAELLQDKCNFKKFSTGDKLRQEIAIKSPLGTRIEKYVNSGTLVPDHIIFEVVRKFLVQNKNSNILFDGYPRTVNQAKKLDQQLTELYLTLQFAVELCLPQQQIIQRLINRRYCPQCNKVFNLRYNPPQTAGSCDLCGGKLVKRKDDTKEVILKRLKVYEQATQPLVKYYETIGKHHVIDAHGTQHEVFSRILKLIDDYTNKK